MKCPVSCFNKTAFRKDVTRFFPAWLLYGLVLVVAGFIMNGAIAIRYYEFSNAYGLYEYLRYMGFINAVFALLNAQLLFGDLFKTKLANALHALPLRRETWFCTHVVAGIAFALVPNLVLALVFIPLLGEMWLVSLCWFAATALQYLFYFGLAVFACMCVGSRIAQSVVYGLCALSGWLLFGVISTFFVPLLPGIGLSVTPFYFFCPMIYGFAQTFPYQVKVEYFIGRPTEIDSVTLTQNPDGWLYLAGVALVGILLLVLALQMYRKRNLEVAGDFIAVSWLKPVFLVLYTLAMGIVFRNAAKLISDSIHTFFMIAGLIIGYLSGTMFLERTVKIFHKRMFAGFALFAAILLGSMGITALDPLDLEHWVPDPALIEQITFSGPGYGYSTVAYNSDGSLNTEKHLIDRSVFTEIHQAILDHEIPVLETKPAAETTPPGYVDYDDFYYYYGAPQYVNGFAVTLHYTLSNGVYLDRDYAVGFNSPAADKIEEFMNHPYIALGSGYTKWEKGLEKFRIKLENGDYRWPTATESTALMQAIFADLDAGTAAQHDLFHEQALFNLNVYFGDTYKGSQGSFQITVYADMENTVRWLQNFGLLDPA